jgi:hypothetical protein
MGVIKFSRLLGCDAVVVGEKDLTVILEDTELHNVGGRSPDLASLCCCKKLRQKIDLASRRCNKTL